MDDYREVLNLRPGFRPESSLVTPEAEERFNKLRAEMISTLKLEIRPADAVLIIDGEKVLPSADGTVAVLAGSRRIRLEKHGYDFLDEELELPAGVEFGYQRQLFPNARDVVVRSWLPGVRVLVDGAEAGVTEHSGEPSAAETGAREAVLVIRDLPLGEHRFDFRMDCHLAYGFNRMITVDIMEPTPLMLPRIELEKIQVPLVVRADFPAAEIFIDGEKAGELQSGMIELCPGDRHLEFRSGGRTVYGKKIEVRGGEPLEFSVSARPTALLAGGGDWPETIREIAGKFSMANGGLEDSNLAATDPAGWTPGDFPPDVDLVFAVLDGDDPGAGGRTVLYSPILDSYRELTHEHVDGLSVPKPVWMVRAPGLRLADAVDGSGIVVVEVRPGGPAEEAGIVPGDTLVAVGGLEVGTLDRYRATLAGTVPDKPVKLQFSSGGTGPAEDRELTVPPADSPYLAAPALRNVPMELMAAWAQVDAAAYPDRSVSARANLALVLAEAGNFEAAVETWKQVRWPGRSGIGEGTRSYYLGIALDRLGKEEQAVRAFRQASASDATIGTDDGPRVAPAARDHLADLGIGPAEPGNGSVTIR
jgi:hypothetical protein